MPPTDPHPITPKYDHDSTEINSRLNGTIVCSTHIQFDATIHHFSIHRRVKEDRFLYVQVYDRGKRNQ